MRKLALLALLLVVALAASATALSRPHKIPGASGTVYAVERSDNGNTAAAFDASTGRVLGFSKVGRRPIGVTAPHGTDKVYTADERSNQLTVIAKDGFEVVGHIATNQWPHHIMSSPNGKFLYFGQYNTNTVGVVDTETDTFAGSHAASHNALAKTHAVWITNDGRFLYATNEIANSVSKLDIENDWAIVWEFPIGNRPSEVLVTPNGKTAYVTVRNDNRLKVLDVSGDDPALLDDVLIGGQPDTLQISNDGRTIVVGLRSTPQMALFDTETREVRHVTFPGYGISGHQWLSANGKFTYIALESAVPTNPGAIAVVDNDSAEIVDIWDYPSGALPHGVFYEPQVLR
jgi:DNA-binding beta-propeller fold protein YncE